MGYVKVPLLRIVNTEGDYGTNVHTSFRNLQYVPVKVNSFETIEMNIKNDRNEITSFYLTIPQGVLATDVKKIGRSLLRQQRGGNIVRFRGARIQIV